MELYQEMVNQDQCVAEWRCLAVYRDQMSVDLHWLEQGDVIVCTPSQVSVHNDFLIRLITNC